MVHFLFSHTLRLWYGCVPERYYLLWCSSNENSHKNNHNNKWSTFSSAICCSYGMDAFLSSIILLWCSSNENSHRQEQMVHFLFSHTLRLWYGCVPERYYLLWCSSNENSHKNNHNNKWSTFSSAICCGYGMDAFLSSIILLWCSSNENSHRQEQMVHFLFSHTLRLWYGCVPERYYLLWCSSNENSHKNNHNNKWSTFSSAICCGYGMDAFLSSIILLWCSSNENSHRQEQMVHFLFSHTLRLRYGCLLWCSSNENRNKNNHQ